MKKIGSMIIAAALVTVMMCGCAGTTGTAQTADASSSSVLEQVESYVSSVRWIIPLASGVISAFFPQYAGEAQLAIASYNGLLTVADEAVNSAKGGAADAAKLASVLTDLQAAWKNLDGAYKADASAVQAFAAAK